MAATKKKSPKKAAPTGKATIYVDVDDEITNIIEKLKGVDNKIVALVLPKRATVLQSVVNMKLLKKAATSSKKNLVLITSETGLLPLAGAAGIHVAKSLQSKPEIPPSPNRDEGETEAEEIQDDEEPKDSNLDKTATVGALAAATAIAVRDDEDEAIELDNVKVDDLPAAPASKSGKNSAKKQKRLKVPNFERFRKGTVLAVIGVILLILGWILAFMVLPKATITIKTDTTSAVSSFDFTADVNQTEIDVDGRRLPAVMKEVKKTETERAAATGERNDGEKAEGSVELKAQACSPNINVTPQAVPKGSTVTSNGKNFITQEAMTFTYAGLANGSCANYESNSGDIVAAEQGASFNVSSGSSFTVSNRSGVSGTGSAEGGSDKIVKIITQKDIDDAVTRINNRLGNSVSDELTAALETEDQFAIKETLKTGENKITASPEVNKEASETTVTSEAAYSMLGVKRDDLTELIKKDVEDEIDFSKQSLIDDGIDDAVMRINNNNTPGQAFISFRTSVTAGPELDEDAIKEAVRGKKRGEVEDYIEALPGVQEAVVEYSPFWVYSTPKAAKKITIVIEKPDNPQTEENSSDQ